MVNYNIENIINKEFEREIWKMDTSHFSILIKFLTNSTNTNITIKKIADNRFQFIEPSFIKRENDPGFSQGAILQYIRVLTFYNVINHKDIEKLNCNSWKCVFDEMLDGNIKLTNFDENIENYLINNIDSISKAIKEQAKSNSKIIFKNSIKILSTMETFLNYKNSPYSRDLKASSFNDFLNNYEFTTKGIRPNGDDEGYIDELKNWLKMYDYCEELFKIILELDTSSSIEDAFASIDFSGYGYLGEYIVDKYLEEKKITYEWVSIKNKYSPFDFKADDMILEVKTPTTKRNKISFNLSWNEYIQHQSKKEKYKILYVDGVYNIDLKKVMKNGINDINGFILENDINIHEIEYKEIRDYRFASKGYWVSEK